MKDSIIKESELKKMIDNAEDFLLLDIFPPEIYDAKHIVGAKNAPVYEVAFLEHVEKLTSDKNKRIVVYNEFENSHATIDAAMKLKEAGYKNVFEFRGGLTKWEKAGHELEKTKKIEHSSIADGKHDIDKNESQVNWYGRNFRSSHHGSLDIVQASIDFKNETAAGIQIDIDMDSIKNIDLEDKTYRGYLEHHLKSSDFFDVSKHPQASLRSKKIEPIRGVDKKTSAYKIVADLNIKSVSNEIEFEALIYLNNEGKINMQAHFDFDRSKWDVRYGSEKFFEKLGMHLVSNIISMDIYLVADQI